MKTFRFTFVWRMHLLLRHFIGYFAFLKLLLLHSHLLSIPTYRYHWEQQLQLRTQACPLACPSCPKFGRVSPTSTFSSRLLPLSSLMLTIAPSFCQRTDNPNVIHAYHCFRSFARSIHSSLNWITNHSLFDLFIQVLLILPSNIIFMQLWLSYFKLDVRIISSLYFVRQIIVLSVIHMEHTII